MNKVEKNFIRDLRRQRIYPTRRKFGDITLMEDQTRLVFSCYECDLETYSLQNFMTHTLQTHMELSQEQITMLIGQISDDEEEQICEELDEDEYEMEMIDEEKYSSTRVFEKIEIEPAGTIETETVESPEFEENSPSDEPNWLTEEFEAIERIDDVNAEKDANMTENQTLQNDADELTAEEQQHCITEIELLLPEEKTVQKPNQKSKIQYAKMISDRALEDLPKTLVVVDENGTTYMCGLCDRTFKIRERYKLHVRRHMGIRPYACQYCDATFVDSSNWGTHTKRHLNIKPHICSYCSKGFISTTELKHHVRSHTGERPYKCTECDRAFKTSTLLNKHFRRHTNERPHVCPTCGKQFYDSTHLKDHELTHSKIKSHSCELCEAKFGRRKALLQHMKLHSGVKQYTCEICYKSFAQGPGLYSHMKTHRKDGKGIKP